MSRKKQRCSILLVIIFVSILVPIQESYTAPTVIIVVNPDVTEVLVGSDPIALTVLASGANLTFEWELVGPGNLEGDSESSAIFYRPPDEIDRKSAKAKVTVIVTDGTGEKTPASAILTINAITSKGKSTLTKTAIGVGTAVALGAGVYLMTGDDNNNNNNKCLDPREDWAHIHDPSYAGKVWIKVVPRYENRNIVHFYRINWGPWVYTNQITFGGAESVTLWHRKEVDEPIPLSFHIEPASCVTFGTGEPSGDVIIDINEGWEKT